MFKMKRKQRYLHVPWDKVFGAAAMINGNEQVLADACKIALREIGYYEVNQDAT